jgi:FHS family L-fucose permease-like MFS transporter
MQKTNSSQNLWVSMLIIGTLFFIFGFITWLNGALIPFLQIVCELSEIESLFVAFSFYISYVVMAMPMARVIEKTGYKNAMSLGLVLIALGCLLFIVAAQNRTFMLFLAAQFIVGAGLTLLQTASNPYLVKMGPHESAAVRISVMGLLNKGAGILAPMVFTVLVLGDFSGVSAKSIEQLPELDKITLIDSLSGALIWPYFGMAITLCLLAILLKLSSLPELNMTDSSMETVTDQPKVGRLTVWQYPNLYLGVITLFFYVGVEVIAGDTIGLLGSKMGVANPMSLTSYTMAFMVIGYLCGLIVIPRFLSQEKALSVSAVIGLVLSLLIVFSVPIATGVSYYLWHWSGLPLLPNIITYIAALGFANAIVWPAVWPMALKGLGQYTERGSALLIMAIAGGAILPIIYGLLSGLIGGQSAYWMMLPCYLFILFYALKGHKIAPRAHVD